MQTFDLFFVELSAEEMMALLQTVQFCGIIIPVIGMIAVLLKEQSKGSVYLILTNAACLIVNCAYLMILDMNTYDSLTTAYRMEYIGISFFFFFFILFMMEY